MMYSKSEPFPARFFVTSRDFGMLLGQIPDHRKRRTYQVAEIQTQASLVFRSAFTIFP